MGIVKAFPPPERLPKLVVLNRIDLSPEREFVEDILAIIHVFSSKLYGLRKYKQKIKEDSDLPGN